MILFRADANTNIGMGHIMRCLSLADAFTATHTDSTIVSGKQDIKFILADAGVLELIHSRGYEPIILNTLYNRMDDEIGVWESLADSIDADLVIVDSYYVTQSYLSWLRLNIGRVVYIDDVLSFPDPVDILVNYNAYASLSSYQSLYSGCEQKPEFILGPTYAPLRPMFQGLERKLQPNEIKNVLISTGGSDELHVAINFIKYICDEQKSKNCIPGITYHVLVGAMNTDRPVIKSLAEKMDNIVLHENVADMRSLISSVDVVISAAGSTLYEICACGVPLITYSLADNQVPGAKAFETLGLAVNCGDLREPSSVDHSLVIFGTLAENSIEKLVNAMNSLATDLHRRNKMGQRMQDLIDGSGAERLAQKIVESVKKNIMMI